MKIRLAIMLLPILLLAACGPSEELVQAQEELVQAQNELSEARADLEAANERIRDLRDDVGVKSIELEALQNDYDSLFNGLTCDEFGTLEPDYNSNKNMSAWLSEYLTGLGNTVVESSFELLWADSLAAIHTIDSERFRDHYVVYFAEQAAAYTSSNGIFSLGGECWLDAR